MISLQVLTKKKQNLRRIYQDSRPQVPFAPKDDDKFETLLAKIFSLNREKNQIFSATLEKINLFLFNKYCSIFRHTQTYSGILKHTQAYSEPYVTLACSEPWYIQNSELFKNRGAFRTLAHSEPETYFRTLVYSEAWSIQKLRRDTQTSMIERFANVN